MSRVLLISLAAGVLLLGLSPVWGQPEPPPQVPNALKTVPVPEPDDIDEFIKDKDAAIRLGKALFWDMQVGSDNQSCASCHFHAGGDNRTKAQLNPGLNADPVDTTYQLGGPNYTVQPEDFPFHKLADPDDRNSAVLFDTNDRMSSQGVFNTRFIRIALGNPRDVGVLSPLDFFTVQGKPVRNVEPRNTPTMINAVFNTDNFWDGRANFWFNGNNPFGPLDLNSKILVNRSGSLRQELVRINKASLASQAVGPPLSDMEMSFIGRTWPDVGKKMLSLPPLGKQLVHPQDSVLGALARARLMGSAAAGLPGLRTTYEAMVKAAIQDKYWNSDRIVIFSNGKPQIQPRPRRALKLTEYTQMEANFALIFGLAVQLYEATLVSDETPFDRFRGWSGQPADPDALTDRQKLGLDVFMGKGKCINCHVGPEFTGDSIQIRLSLQNRVELMLMAQGTATYDGGFYNIGVRPTAEDISRGGTSPFVNPKTGELLPLSYSRLALLKKDGQLPAALAQFVPDFPGGDNRRVAVDGAFKVPGLRNVELTGPYFHNGGQATLRQVVQFYDRGGDFHEQNIDNLDPDITDLDLTDEEKEALVDFLLALTDQRVKDESAPFDHPQLFIPDGARGDENEIDGNVNRILRNGFRDTELVREIPAVGAGGLPALGRPSLEPFLGLDPFQLNTAP